MRGKREGKGYQYGNQKIRKHLLSSGAGVGSGFNFCPGKQKKIDIKCAILLLDILLVSLFSSVDVAKT